MLHVSEQQCTSVIGAVSCTMSSCYQPQHPFCPGSQGADQFLHHLLPRHVDQFSPRAPLLSCRPCPCWRPWILGFTVPPESHTRLLQHLDTSKLQTASWAIYSLHTIAPILSPPSWLVGRTSHRPHTPLLTSKSLSYDPKLRLRGRASFPTLPANPSTVSISDL